MCVCLCVCGRVFGRESNCELLWKCMCLRVHCPVRMHQCWWHKAQPQLDLTLIWIPLWRQSGFVCPHTSTEEDMEKICRTVSLGDYMAPLNSRLNNAPNPVVPFHRNYGFCLWKKKLNLYTITPSHLWQGCSWACMCVPQRELVLWVCVCVCTKRGLHVEIEMDKLKHNIGLIF